MIKKINIVILAVTMITGSYTCSANSIKQVSVEPETEVLTVNGALETPCENALVDLWITDDNDETVALRQARTNENGEYTFSVGLSGMLTKGGRFKLRTIGQIEDAAYYTDENGNDGVEMYLHDEIADVLNIISDNKNDVNLNTDYLNENKAIIGYRIPSIKKFLDDGRAEEIAAFINTTDMNEQTAVSVLEQIAEIKTVQYGSSDEILALLQDSNCLNGLKENSTYKKMNTSYIESYASLLAASTAAYDSEDEFMEDAVDKAVIAELYNVRGTEGTKKALDTFAEMFDFSVYNRSGNNKDAAVSSIRKLAENNALSSCAQVQEILDTYTAESGSSTVSGGGGGGGGGGGSGIAVSANTGLTASEIFSEENVTPDSNAFKDMDGYEWASDSVTKLYKAGIINGVAEDEFAPASSVTRAEFSKMICKVFALKPARSQSAFADVSSSDWYAPYVQSLYETGAVTGVDENNFSPESEIRRQDVCAIIYRLLTGEGDTLSTAELSFEDSDEVAEYAKEAVSSLFAAGLIKGSDGKFMPNELMTRAEAAVLISRLNDYRNGVTR